MKTVFVFRFEDEEGRGPFGNGHTSYFRWASEKKGGKGIDPWNMPGPSGHLDHGTEMQKYLNNYPCQNSPALFCFTNFDQILKCFGCKKGMKAMEKYGTFLYVYEVPEKDVFLGNTQSVFKKDKAVKIGKLKYHGV